MAKSERNKTIDITVEDGQEYLSRCVSISSSATLDDVLDKTILGDVILDLFLGSGSTSVAAKKLGRHYIGIEQNPQYCVWAELCLDKAKTGKAIQGYADGVFWERNTGSLQKAKKGETV